MPIIQRLLPRLVVQPDGCMTWPGATNRGYGVIKHPDGRQLYTHRIVWEHFRGSIADGLQIDHLCKNKLCANADHLEVVTPRENVLRSTGPAAANAAKDRCGKCGGEYYQFRERERRCRTCENAGQLRRYHERKAKP